MALLEILLPLANRLGLPGPFLSCLGNLCSRLQRFVKFSKGFGATPLPTKCQGYAISVGLLNVLGTVSCVRLTPAVLTASGLHALMTPVPVPSMLLGLLLFCKRRVILLRSPSKV